MIFPTLTEAQNDHGGRLICGPLTAPATSSADHSALSVSFVSLADLKSGAVAIVDVPVDASSTQRAGMAVVFLDDGLNLQTNPFSAIRIELTRVGSLPDDWDGDGAASPNVMARKLAWLVLDACEERGKVPSGIVPSSDGGIAVTFRVGSKYADIECFNDGDILAVVDLGTGAPIIWPVVPEELASALDELHDRLGA